jgi:hypothetical protein
MNASSLKPAPTLGRSGGLTIPLPVAPSAPTATFDYTLPRTLHGGGSPRPLSSLDEPIQQVVEDIREQRMSLCQSLRQYVFVHQAIIEGALALVEEEHAAEAEGALPDQVPGTSFLDVPAMLKAKRRHSATELVKEDRQGATMLSKRPSIKRINKEASYRASYPTPPNALG